MYYCDRKLAASRTDKRMGISLLFARRNRGNSAIRVLDLTWISFCFLGCDRDHVFGVLQQWFTDNFCMVNRRKCCERFQ